MQRQISNLPWVTLSLVVGAIAVWNLPDPWRQSLAWNRPALGHGELWRLETGHLVHFSKSHLAWDLLVAALAGAWIECAGFRGGRWLFVLAPPAIGIVLWLGDPTLEVYGGLSGLATAGVVFACLSELGSPCKSGSTRGGHLKFLWIAILSAICAKTVWEFFSAHSLFARFDGGSVRPVPLSHLAGAGIAILLFGATLVSGASIEQKLIFPGAVTHGRADAVVTSVGSTELVTLRLGDGTKITAQFGRAFDSQGALAADPKGHATLIFFYGNGSCIAYMAPVVEHFRRLGVNVLMPEYPGYGMSEGSPSEKGFYATGDAAYHHALGRPDVDSHRIVLGGWSMGAAVAVDLASRRTALALITVSAFTSLPATAHALVPWFPTSLIIRSQFDNLSKIARVSCPILIAHGSQDRLVPPSMAKQLAAAAHGPPTVLELPGAAHNDVFKTEDTPLWGAMDSFIRNHSSPPP